MTDLQALKTLIIEAAQTLGASAEPGLPEWTGQVFNAEVLRPATGGTPFERLRQDLPQEIDALLLDDIPVLLGSLPPTAHLVGVQDALRRYRNQAAIARSWLGPAAPNLQIFFYGPPGVDEDRAWRQLAAVVEADDRICRKLVWLFPEANPETALHFLQRTFLARPWPDKGLTEALDQLEVSLPKGWEDAVDNRDLDNEGLVRVLVDLEGDPE